MHTRRGEYMLPRYQSFQVPPNRTTRHRSPSFLPTTAMATAGAAAPLLYLSYTALALLVLSTAIVLHYSLLSSSIADPQSLADRGVGGRAIPAGCRHDDEGGVSRESFPLEGDVAWIVQISDLHLSTYHPERGEDLDSLLAPALRLIRPSLVLITGDITDAKNQKRTSSRQDEKEWICYKNIISSIIKESGMDKRRFIDLRGNHDKYGVPCVGNKLDFFSVYSISSQLGRIGTVQSISLAGKDRRYIFLGIDDTMKEGIRGPSHLFGHPTDARIKMVESELQNWDEDPDIMVTKVVFGHFPLSFTSSSETGKRYEVIFAKHSVSTYLCGHLHAKFGSKLWRKHVISSPTKFKQKKEIKQFMEWELGDWKESRLVRILAIDQGMVSFIDVSLGNKPGHRRILEAAVLITHPIDSRHMYWHKSKNQTLGTNIRALVFSVEPIVNVTARVYDSFRSFALVEEIPLKLANDSGNHHPLFHSSWDTKNYEGVSPMCYWIQVFVTDIRGREFTSEKRPFSAHGKAADVPVTWLSYVLFHIQWERLYLILLWSNIILLVILIFLPKVAKKVMKNDALYHKWASSVSTPLPNLRRILFTILWFLIEGSRNEMLWGSMVFYLVYLVAMPWFWGHATSESGEISKMFMFGWKINPARDSSHNGMMGYPDVMSVTIPFMYLVVAPLFLLIYSLLSERSAFYLHNKKPNYGKEYRSVRKVSDEICQSNNEEPPELRRDRTSSCVNFVTQMGRMRTVILFSCLVLTCIHVKLVSALMEAYGVRPVALSPAICWVPPLLLSAATYYSTSPAYKNG